MSHPFTDIIIPVHDAFDYLKDCVRTVYDNTSNFRIIVVDDASQTPKAKAFCDYILDKDKNNVLVRTNKQNWFSRACNLGLRMVRSKNAVLLNSDCVVNTGWLEELYGCKEQFIQENPYKKIGLVASVLDVNNPIRYVETFEPNYCTGHCWLLDMEAAEQLALHRGTPGWFFNELDRQQIHINSDRIGCYDLNRLGYSTILSYHACVGHEGGKSWQYDLGAVGQVNLSDVDYGA